MAKFIKLLEVRKHITLLININNIVAIKDMRTDPATKNVAGWEWTDIECSNGVCYKVEETEEEILKLIER